MIEPPLLSADDLAALRPGIDPEKAEAWIGHAEALALLEAPCLADPLFTGRAAAKSVLVSAILRWEAAGDGTVTNVSAGPFSKTVDSTSKPLTFWPSEVKLLRALCGRGGGRRGVFHVPMG